MNRTQYIKKRKTNKENLVRMHVKTEEIDDYSGFQQAKVYSPSQEFLKNHKPFLQNNKVQFNVRPNRSLLSNRTQATTLERPLTSKQNNIEKLKREIKELDQQDFISFRSKNYGVDDIRVFENDKINHYNKQNSLIVELKAKILHNKSSENKLRNTVSRSSVPRKYYSKPNTRGTQKETIIPENDQNKCLKGQKMSIIPNNFCLTIGCSNTHWIKRNKKFHYKYKRNQSMNNIYR